MALKEFPQIHRLPLDKKLALVDDLWKEVAEELDQSGITEEEKSLLDSRWINFSRNPESALTVEEFQSQLNKIRQ